MFDLISEKQKRPKVKWTKTWWEFQKSFFFICESVEDLVRWCYPDILSLLFQYTSRKACAIAPKNDAVNHIHILALSLLLSEIFIFEIADSVKSGQQAGTFAVEYLYCQHLCFWTPPLIQTLPKKVVESHVLQQAVLHICQVCVAL